MSGQPSPGATVPAVAVAIHNDEKRSQIRRYYAAGPNLALPIILMAVGLLFLLPDGTRGLGILMAMGGAAWLFVPLARASNRPADEAIDAWLHEDVMDLIARARQRLNLEESQVVRDPLPIVGIVLRSAASIGVPVGEVRSRKGADGLYRFSIRSVTIFHLFEHKVSSYQCFYNTIRGVPLNERDDEYYYRDIVSVSTTEVSTNHTLPNGVTMRHWQAFKMSVASGEHISVIVSPADLMGSDAAMAMAADSGADNAIRALRKMLEEKKLH